MTNFNFFSRLASWMDGLSSCIRPVSLSYSGSSMIACSTERQPRDNREMSEQQSGARVAREWLKYTAAIMLVLTLGMSEAWGAEGDTHEFTSVAFSKLLNNNATISDVTIPDPGYPVKKIVANCRYNNAAGGVTISIKIGGVAYGTSKTHNAKSTVDLEFTDSQKTGNIVLSFKNNCGSGTGKGTFYLNSVTLVEGSSASCSADPTIGAASLNGSFNMTSTTSGIGVASGTCNTGNAACSWTDYGFVWSDGTATTTPTVSNNKVQIGTSGSATSWTGTITPSGSTTPNSWTAGHTYYVRAYGKNSKASATYYYGTAWSFTPRLVTFHKNDGGATTSTQYVQGGVSTALTTNSFSRTGYTFAGWNTNADGTSGTSYTNGQSINLDTNLDLYAKWTAKTTTVSFNQNSGTGGQTSSVTATYGQAMPTPIATPTREGYDFGGYYDGSGGTGNKYYNADGTSAESWNKESATATLYAKWTVQSYSVAWMVNGSEWSGKGGSSSVEYGSHISTLPTTPDPKNDACGDKFVGWTDATDGNYVHGTSNLYKTASDFPNASGAQVFYAVFADYDE